jgi:carbonic anhydrase
MKDIAKFLHGFKQFQRHFFCSKELLYKDLQAKQTPNVLVVACSDSRVDPAILTGCEPGDMFVVRNVANLVPPYETSGLHHGVSAALEYGVTVLEVGHIIVLGHSYCGGIQALMEDRRGVQTGQFISPWVRIAQSARDEVMQRLAGKTPQARAQACEMAAILVSMENLLSFPWIAERVEAGSLHIHGWYFDMETGELRTYMPETGEFEVLVGMCEELPKVPK